MSTRTLRDYFASLPNGSDATFVSPGLKKVGTDVFANRSEVDAAIAASDNAANLANTAIGLAGTAVQSIIAGSNITINNSDPQRPIISTTGGGAVTSVGLAAPTGFSVSGSPVTGSGTLAFSYATGYQGYTSAEAGKLGGIATGATANQTDAYLLNRANHTGTQLAATISDFSTAADARISAAVGVSVQAFSAKLGALAAQTWAADKITYQTGAGTVGVTPLTSFGRSLIDDANAAAARTTLGLAIGTDVQAYSSLLASLSGLSLTGKAGQSVVVNAGANGFDVTASSGGGITTILDTTIPSGQTTVDFTAGLDGTYRRICLSIIYAYGTTTSQNCYLRVRRASDNTWVVPGGVVLTQAFGNGSVSASNVSDAYLGDISSDSYLLGTFEFVFTSTTLQMINLNFARVGSSGGPVNKSGVCRAGTIINGIRITSDAAFSSGARFILWGEK